MDMGDTGELSINLDTLDTQQPDDHHDDDVLEREVEINGLLSDAFDDISSVSDVADEDHENEGEDEDEEEDDSDDDGNYGEEDEEQSLDNVSRDNDNGGDPSQAELGDEDSEAVGLEDNGLDDIEDYIKKMGLDTNGDKKPVATNGLRDSSNPISDLRPGCNPAKNLQQTSPSFTEANSVDPKIATNDSRTNNIFIPQYNQKFTSTPIKDLYSTVPRKRLNDFSNAPIPEESEDKVNGYHHLNDDCSISSEDDVDTSQDFIRNHYTNHQQENFPNIQDNESHVDMTQLSYKHVQLLLDDNQKLAEENRILKAKINVLNGDQVGLAFNFQQLEAKCQAKNKEIVELEGKLAAIEVQLKSETEAKLEAQAKSAVLESTVDSLNRQIADMARSDSTVRLRENYEAMLTKLRNKYDTDTIVLKGEIEGLKYELERRQQEMEKLSSELQERNKSIQNQEIEKLTNLDSLKQKYEEILRETSNKVEYESLLRRKNEEIQSLQREISFLKSNPSINNQSSSSNQSIPTVCKCGKDSEVVKELKKEFEKSLANLQTRRNQITTLQTQLTAAKKDNVELKGKLKDIEEKYKELNDFLKTAHDLWKQEVEARLAIQYKGDLRKTIKALEEEKKDEIERSFNQRLERYVDQLIGHLKSFSEEYTSSVDGDQDLDNIFAPLRKLWKAINRSLEDKVRDLDEAKNNLQKALQASKSFETLEHSSITDEFRQELDKVKDEAAQTNAKLAKYKRNYHRLISKHENEIQKLKEEYATKISEREMEYRLREEKLIRELSEEPVALYRKLNNYCIESTTSGER